MKWPLICILLVTWTAQGAVDENLRSETGPRAQGAPSSVYDARGVMKAIDRENRQAVISHEPIVGYMGAMTMSFDVADFSELGAVKPGDEVTFRLCVTADRAWIEHVAKTGAKVSLPLTPAPTKPLSEVKLGEQLPAFEFVDETGQKRGLDEYRGHALAITFIYTRCPLPTFCPLLNRHFQTAQQLLERLSPNNKTHFLSLTLDPEHDTPAVLAGYAKGNEADPARWTFAVTDSDALRTVGASVGLEIKRSGEQIDHNLRTVVLDGAGRVRHLFRGNAWTPQELAAAMRRAETVPSPRGDRGI